MSPALSETTEQMIQKNLDQVATIILNAADWAGAPDLQQNLKTLCDALDPFCAPAYARPDIPYFLGLMMLRIGHTFRDVAPSLNKVYESYFDRAHAYYQKAAAIKTPWNNLDPAIAKLALSRLYEFGLVGAERKPDRAKAFSLCLEAAQEGCAEAQLYTAVNYFEGFGTSPSLTDAVFWINAADENKEQLPPSLLEDIEEAKPAFETAFMRAYPSDDPRDRLNALHRARVSLQSFLTTRPQ